MKPLGQRRAQGRAGLAVAIFGLGLALLGWWLAGALSAEPAPVSTAAAAVPTAATASAPGALAVPLPPASAPRPGPPLTEAERQARRAVAQARLERAQEALATYQQAARYPHESRPASEHPDQLRPFDPVAEEHPLRMPGGSAAQGVRLKTTQERIFLAGRESARVTVALVDAQERPLPLRVQRAVLREVPSPGATSRAPDFVLALTDNGQGGDAVPGDGVLTAWVQPALQGFDTVAGLVRLELNLEYAGQPGFLYFDFIFSPEQAARWLPGVREELRAGSLLFHLKAEVLIPGRYVVSARVDDANGRSFAMSLFNDELRAGTQEIRLPVFGKLVRDEQPAFPLRLRDVEAFLLKPDAHPDRVMLPRLAGILHTSRSYTLNEFSDASWQSAERDRYLAELQRDVDGARRALEPLGP